MFKWEGSLKRGRESRNEARGRLHSLRLSTENVAGAIEVEVKRVVG